MARHIPRLYVQGYALNKDQKVILLDQQHHYLTHVLRCQVGATVLLFNEEDGEWECHIETINKNLIRVSVDTQQKQPAPLLETHIYFAPLRKERLMDVMEKGTELGVTHFHPIITEHTSHKKINMDKLEIYVQDASEQCGRCEIPKISPPVKFTEVLENFPTDKQFFLAMERENLKPLSINKTHDDIHLAVGPEGGWSEQEKLIFSEKNFIQPFSLGQLTLRAETAVIASLSLVNYFRALSS